MLHCTTFQSDNDHGNPLTPVMTHDMVDNDNWMLLSPQSSDQQRKVFRTATKLTSNESLSE